MSCPKLLTFRVCLDKLIIVVFVIVVVVAVVAAVAVVAVVAVVKLTFNRATAITHSNR